MMNESASPTQSGNQWNSPVLIIALAVALIVAMLWAIAAKNSNTTVIRPLGEQVENTNNTDSRTPGASISEEKTTTSLESLSSPEVQNNLLVSSTLKTIHTGRLVNSQLSQVNSPTDTALVLELSTPQRVGTTTFEFTRAEIDNARSLLVTNVGLENFQLADLQPGYGVSITRITNLMATNEPDEIIFEIVLQDGQQ